MEKDLSAIKRIACIGEVMIELIDDGHDRLQMNVAGDTFNTAVYLKRMLGNSPISVSYVTALGTDRLSKKILTTFDEHGLDASFIETRPDRTPGLYMIETSSDGERSFSYWRSESAARTLFQEPCQVSLEVLKTFDMVVVSGITLAILPEDIRQAFFVALEQFRAGGGVVVYDSNHRPRLWEDVETARTTNMSMWAANIGPNLFHQNRTVSWLISMPRSCRRSSTLRSESGTIAVTTEKGHTELTCGGTSTT